MTGKCRECGETYEVNQHLSDGYCNFCREQLNAESFVDDSDACCYRGGGLGVIVTCIDDMCRGSGECIHGDGEAICPVCKGGY